MLSPRTIRLRFFGTLGTLPEEVLKKLVSVENPGDVSLVATHRVNDRERALGLFSIMCDQRGKTGEFAMVIADAWQGKGIGAELFRHGLALAQKRGVVMVWGNCLAENTHALALARRMGFVSTWDFEENAYRLQMH
ncbi:MAG: GNAT family N-acetyltransferase, partial [Deltaproteobacteria bacterium]|nr:GNAT family N-acetyltransferase [Deltaproteobacteria bacterium]